MQESSALLHRAGLPLSGHSNDDAHPRTFRFAKNLWRLNRQRVDEEIGHTGFEIVKQWLQRRLRDLDARGQADEAVFSLRPVDHDLRREDGSAGFGDGGADALLQGRAGDGDGLAFDKG